MKKLVTLTLFTFILYVAKADKIYKHSGDIIDCTVVAVENGSVTYIYKNETATNVLGKYAIDKIVFDSGREQIISQKYTAVDADSVVITIDIDEVVGLKEVATIRSSSNNWFNFLGVNGLDKKSAHKLQKHAISKGAFIVLLTADYKESAYGYSKYSVGNKTTSVSKKGICYTY